MQIKKMLAFLKHIVKLRYLTWRTKNYSLTLVTSGRGADSAPPPTGFFSKFVKATYYKTKPYLDSFLIIVKIFELRFHHKIVLKAFLVHLSVLGGKS